MNRLLGGVCIIEEGCDEAVTFQPFDDSIYSLIPIRIELATFKDIVQSLTNDATKTTGKSCPPTNLVLEDIGVCSVKMVHEQSRK